MNEMKPLSDSLEKLGLDITNSSKEENHISLNERFAINFNNSKGKLLYYDCPICKNRGLIAIYHKEDDSTTTKKCECMKFRDSQKSLVDDNMDKIVKSKTFDNYNTNKDWQQEYKEKAIKFINQREYRLFFIGGQSGSGKSHLCTALYGKITLDNCYISKYMLWNSTVKNLVSIQYKDYEEYQYLIKPFYETKVLYIDDFLKPIGDDPTPSNSTLSIAYDIINERYNKKDLITIISSEFSLRQITRFDTAIGGRIYEMCGNDFLITVDGKEKNVRFHKELMERKKNG